MRLSTAAVASLALQLLACGSSRPTSPRPAPPSAAETRSEPAHRPAPELVRNEVLVDGHTLVVWEKHRGDEKRTLLLIHGRTWSSVPNFDLQVPGEDLSLMDHLVDAGVATYAIDLRGYGATERDATGWITPRRALADVVAVLDWLETRGAERPTVLGWSWGSLVARMVAERHPEKVLAVVLYGYPRPVDWQPEAKPVAAEAERRPTTREAAAEDFITPNTISPRAIATYVDAAIASDPVRADWRAIEDFGRLDAENLRVPSLIIHGEHDPYAPQSQQEALYERIASEKKRLVTLPGLDHAAHLEDPDTFVAAIVSFLALPEGGRSTVGSTK